MKNKNINLLSLAIWFLIAAFLIMPNIAVAHPGNTAADGCHYCWTNCDYWGEVYGERHCRGGNIYTPYDPDPWVCKIGEQKFYSHASANNYWNNQIKEVVDHWYLRILERTANQNDYDHWIANFPYSNCRGINIDQKKMENELNNSEEKKQLNDKKINELKAVEHRDGIRLLYKTLLGRSATNEEVENWASKESDIKVIETATKDSEEYKNYIARKASGNDNWFWWFLAGGGLIYGGQLAYKKYIKQ